VIDWFLFFALECVFLFKLYGADIINKIVLHIIQLSHRTTFTHRLLARTGLGQSLLTARSGDDAGGVGRGYAGQVGRYVADHYIDHVGGAKLVQWAAW
jgi:hypothetical protein